jgi:uncharacterized protein YegP (UPF0339 family)
MAAKFELFKDADGKFRFRLKAANGEIIASSEGYKSKTGAENGIKSVKTNAPGATVVDKTKPTVPTKPEEKRQRTHDEVVEIQKKLNKLARKHKAKLIK